MIFKKISLFNHSSPPQSFKQKTNKWWEFSFFLFIFYFLFWLQEKGVARLGQPQPRLRLRFRRSARAPSERLPSVEPESKQFLGRHPTAEPTPPLVLIFSFLSHQTPQSKQTVTLTIETIQQVEINLKLQDTNTLISKLTAIYLWKRTSNAQAHKHRFRFS